MRDLLMYGMPEGQAEEHRRALGDLRKQVESHGLRCRLVERLHLPMRSGYYTPVLRPPEMDVYGGGRLVVTVTVVDVPKGGAWYLLKRPDGLPVEAHSVTGAAAAAVAIAAYASPP
ncbi:hypothetical protein [Sphaerisporangium album]|uniref:hypothetical protein n=1 Tax=Sphaerisporangium album TaxID=509200 RepID=UPI0011C07832|nr:hypothetical protein [Sphaerisporangium album]